MSEPASIAAAPAAGLWCDVSGVRETIRLHHGGDLRIFVNASTGAHFARVDGAAPVSVRPDGDRGYVTSDGKRISRDGEVRDKAGKIVRWSIPAAQAGSHTADVPPEIRVTMTQASRIRPEPVTWLWPGWLAAAKVHVLAGPPGAGKTTVALTMAATVTTGGAWPDGTRSQRGPVVIWSGEDGHADTLIPRLKAAGADLGRVLVISDTREEEGKERRAFDPSADTGHLAAELAYRGEKPRLVIIDPLVATVRGDDHGNAHVRRSLQPLAELARETGCAVLGLAHWGKSSAGRDPLARVSGSLAYGALARIVLYAAKMPDHDGGGRILGRAKNNLGADGGGYRYDLAGVILTGPPPIETCAVTWGERVDGTAAELAARVDATAPKAPTERDEAADWLRGLLADGPMEVEHIRSESEAAGYAWRTIERARSVVGVNSERHGFPSRSVWSMSPVAPVAPVAPT